MSNLLLEASDINTPPERLEKLAHKTIELARVVAKNPSAPPDLLEDLFYHQEDEELHQNIVSNPNTPIDALLELGAEFPRELVNNPVFPLLLLENPHLFDEMPSNTIISILRLNDIPEEYFAMAADCEDDKVLTVIANHIKAPEQALIKIVSNTCEEYESYLAAISHVNYKLEKIDIWRYLVNKSIQHFYFLRHIREKEEFLYDIGIVPESCLPGLLENTRVAIVINPQTPIHLKELVDETLNEDPPIEVEAARNPETPIETLIELSNIPFLIIKKALAENPSTPMFVLKKLAREDIDIKANISRNYNATNSLLRITYRNESIAKIIRTVRHQKNSTYILSTILQNHKIYEFSDGHIDFNSVTSQKFGTYLNVEENVHNNVFQQLKTVSNIDLLIALARHPKTPAYLFDNIYKCIKKKDDNGSPDIDKLCKIISILLTKNSQTPVHILLKLTQNNDFEVRRAAINNIQTNFALYNQNVAEFLRQLEQANNPESSPNTLLTIANNNNRDVSLCFAVAQNPNTPASVLDKLAFHKSRDVRLAVTKNSNTTIDTLVTLTKKRKGCLHVRKNAIKALLDKDPQKAGAAIAEFVSSKKPSVPRFIFLLHELVPVEFLEKHADSLSWLERYAVAQNPNTPQHLRAKLSKDANRVVRAAAWGKKIGDIL